MKLAILGFLIAHVVAAAAAAESPLVGVWEGEHNGLPAVRVTIEQSGDKISGRIAFLFQERGPDGAWQTKDPNDGGGQMLAVKVDGKTVTFEVQHHKQHGGTELGPNVPFRVQVVSPTEARLFKLDEGDPGKGLKLIRRK